MRDFFHLECPSCEWDCIVGPPGIGDLGLTCPLCAADNGRDVYLRTVEGPLPESVEGYDARAALPATGATTTQSDQEKGSSVAESAGQLGRAGPREAL